MYALKTFHIVKLNTGAAGVTCFKICNYSTGTATDPKCFNLASLKRGTGGRSSFSGVVATVFGATGFLGRYVVNRLGKIGSQVIIPYRGDSYEPMRLKVAGDLGQILFQHYHLRNEDALNKAVYYSNVVINLVGRDWETKNFKFYDVHCKGAAAIARAAKKAGVEKFIHVSALNVDKSSPGHVLRRGSQFLASKCAGEQAVLAEFPDAVIIRPADMYGQEDRFLRYYLAFWRRQGTWLPLWKKGECTVKQPVHVSDVAHAIINAIKDPDSNGKIYQAVGPKRYKLSSIVDWIYQLTKKDESWGYWRYDMRYDPLFKLKVSLTNALSPSYPVANVHWERIERECVTDDVKEDLPTLEDLGVTLTAMEDQVPWEVRPFYRGRYHDRDLTEFGERPPPPQPVV
ncbi:NADH dehydrogenase [ubiquinone] 1 alpha subcomplex subunit 9, mitochondrial [Agrilus planipennis]|uniref:NADH dehydrogenase [ubiquinone] 1 alpha subcomplex subunit 9, mitochondrial n=1 Tax=Agrilus planipennis TaxID=224129 RepID=A0A1W4WVJ5_AGRPL|nr:NADH dehydrogenase [ubiquinone] 1 alpha subcomplex subunit 9, mitochondrial [Agrilus planipennis]